MAGKLHICIDCGGSKTAAALSTLDETNGPIILSRGYGGPSNYKDGGLRPFLAAIRTATTMALNAALGQDVSLPTVDSVMTTSSHMTDEDPVLFSAWIGASGVDAQQDIRTLEPILSRLLGIPYAPQRLVIQNDSHILSSPLLTVAEPIRDAVVAIAGTGSVVVSFRKQRLSHQDPTEGILQLARAGGWGYLLGDEGSGFAAGKEAVREVLRIFNESELEEGPKEERGGRDTLTSLLLSHYKLNSPDELFSVVYAPDSVPDVFVDESGRLGGPDWAKLNRKERMTSICPIVFHAAFQLKDESALRALRTSASGMARQVSSLCTGTGSASVGKRIRAESAVLCLGGSLFKVQEYRDLLLAELAALGQRFEKVVYVDDPCKEGALGLAKLFS